MDDLISRQAAIEIADAVWIVTGDKNVAKVWDKLQDSPTIDAVQVVRCKECKYCNKVDEYELWCEGRGYPCTLVKSSDFCSFGERKEEDV